MTSGRKVDESRKEFIINQHVAHKVPVRTLSAAYGMTPKTIYGWLKEAGIEKQPKQKPPPHKPDSDRPARRSAAWLRGYEQQRNQGTKK